jgi:hypothetical protein
MFVLRQLAQVTDDRTGFVEGQQRELFADAHSGERRKDVRERDWSARSAKEIRKYGSHAPIGDLTGEVRDEGSDPRDLVDDDHGRSSAPAIDVVCSSTQRCEWLDLETFKGEWHDTHVYSNLIFFEGNKLDPLTMRQDQGSFIET